MNEMRKETPDLPGFRFHPTEDELLGFYLKRMVFGNELPFDVIGFFNIYHYDPWDLPRLAKMGEREWYFFVPRDYNRSNGNGTRRPNRTTENGFWKATGSDRRIVSLSNRKQVLGLKKTLVFYKGRAPRGCKTDWVMNEYRLPDNLPLPKNIVLCKIYRKATPMKELKQRAVMKENMKNSHVSPSIGPSPMDGTVSFGSSQEEDIISSMTEYPKVFKPEVDEEVATLKEEGKNERKGSSPSLKMPMGLDDLTDIQVPKITADWNQDLFWTPLNSPWLQNLVNYADILNF